MSTKKKFLLLSPYPIGKAPSQRLKYEQYIDIFRANGYLVTSKSFVSNSFWEIIYKEGFFTKKVSFILLGYFKRFLILFQLHKFDIVYIHLWVTPIGISFFERLVRLFSNKIVYDIDDMVFLGHSSDANKFWKVIKGKNKMIYLMKSANHVITCTPKLDEFVQHYNKNTTDISSTVDTAKRYQPVNQYKNDHQLVLGWSGSHSTSKYLYLLADTLKKLAKKYDFKLLVMGDSSFKIEGVNVEAFEWNEAM